MTEHLAEVIAACADPAKRKFEKDHLAWLKLQMDIQCATCDNETAGRNVANPTAGIAQDIQEELDWSDRELCGNEEEDDESDWGVLPRVFGQHAARICPFFEH